MIKEYLKLGKKLGLASIIVIIIGYLLVSFSFIIPSSAMSGNMEKSAELLYQEECTPHEPRSNKVLDNYTDALMLLQAAYAGEESIFDKGIGVYFNLIDDMRPYESLLAEYINKDEGGVRSTRYSHYWQGYLIFLRPLLVLTDYGTIRILNGVALSVLSIIAALLLIRFLPRALLPFCLCALLAAPTAVCNNMNFSSICYISLLGMILLVWNPKHCFDGERVRYLFFGIGIATTYFDYLTAPTATLSLLLAILCLQRENSDKRLKLMIECLFCWSFGYAGMWLGKWGIALIIKKQEFLDQLVSHLTIRFSKTSLTNESVTRIGTLNLNLNVLFENIYIDYLIGAYGLILIIYNLYNRRRITNKRTDTLLLLFIPGLIGIAWILVLTNHSNVHYWFTYRTLIPCVFCILCALDLGGIAEGVHK